MILIVDDDRSVRTSLARLFRSHGYEAKAFALPEEYLDYVGGARKAPSCVILDLLGPGMSGLFLQEVINRSQPRVPVIVLSGCEDTELLSKALVAGAAKVLRKPCDPAVLLRAVADAVGQSPPSPPQAGPPMAASDDPDRFVLEEGRGCYRPTGFVSLDDAVAMVRAAIAAARKHQVRSLLVDTRALTGFLSPDTFDRFLAIVEWAEEASGGVRLAMVARAEMIHPEKFGVLVAANRGLASNIFTTEVEARAWLAVWEGQ